MRKLTATLILMSALIGQTALAQDSSTAAESQKLQNNWGRSAANFNDDKAKVVDLVDSIFREDGLAEQTAPKNGQTDQSSFGTKE